MCNLLTTTITHAIISVMVSICTLKRKIKDIRYKYGESAVKYFIKYPTCEICDENRLIVLNIHHIEGKKIDKFKTLCFNCHMIEHYEERSKDTYNSCIEKCKTNEMNKKNKHEKILQLLNDYVPIRNIVKYEKTSVRTINQVMKKNDFISIPCKGYKKINGE
jgi:hypothetical protein